MRQPIARFTNRIILAGAVLAGLSACSRRADKTAADTGGVAAPVASAPVAPPSVSLDCNAPSGDVAKVVCVDAGLSALDQKLGTVYREAEAKQSSPLPAWFTAEQHDWSAARDACATRANARACLDTAYTRRIAAIQATSLLVPTKGPVTYACGDPDAGRHDEIIVMFAETEPRSVVLDRGDKSVVAYHVRSGSGAKYEGANVVFWDKGGEAQVTWLGTALTCHEQAGTS